jgi:hypothetical protein
MGFMILYRAIPCLRRRAARAQADTLVLRGALKSCFFSQISKLFGPKSIPPAESPGLKIATYKLSITNLADHSLVPTGSALAPNAPGLVQNAFQLVQKALQLVQNGLQLVQNGLQLVHNTSRLVQKNHSKADISNVFNTHINASAQ